MTNIHSRRKFFKQAGLGGLLTLTQPELNLSPGKLENPFVPKPPDHVIRSVPENMVWGYYGADVPAVAEVSDGDVVEIHSISTSGIPREDPLSFFEANKIPSNQHTEEVLAIIEHVKPEPSGIRGHMLTGPIYIRGAEPGDSLEIRIHDIKLRSDFGVNHTRPGGGAIPDDVQERESIVYRYDFDKQTASPFPGVEIPLSPFMGVMALSPAPEEGRVSSIPPGYFGGNLDLRHLVKGTTLHLPVSVSGGMFTTGDAHAAQGNGEVSGTAIETSMTLVAEFVVHKGKSIKGPWAESEAHFMAIGLDPDVDEAMRNAVRETIRIIQEKTGLSYNQALSVASIAVDFEVTQVVDRNLGVHGMIPKSIFTNHQFPYWYKSS
ncbi:acetamidase/formamidase family protein [Catalinimonas sp. 4WD22]|uniref:acetamidase/formamidase family protein n=1 Tax=Catalinimonas locisalis TaxID=3133978 RepID=UPI0031015731